MLRGESQGATVFTKSLCRSAAFHIESLCGIAVGVRCREADMLDIIFIVLGTALIALTGFYALALQRL